MRTVMRIMVAALLVLVVAAPLEAQNRRASQAKRCGVLNAELGFRWQGDWERQGEDEGWAETVTVREVFDDAAAAGALEEGDRVIRVNGLVATAQLFWSLRRTLEPGDSVEFLIDRDGDRRTVTVEARTPVEREGECSGRCEDREG